MTSPAFKLLLVVALGLALFAVAALADDDYDYDRGYDDYAERNKNLKGPCKGGYWPDGKGCCPEIIKGKAYYRDYNKCYPRDLDCGVFYSDEDGYVPTSKKRAFVLVGWFCKRVVPDSLVGWLGGGHTQMLSR